MEDKINNEGEIDLLTVWNSIVREKFLIIFFLISNPPQFFIHIWCTIYTEVLILLFKKNLIIIQAVHLKAQCS